MSIIHAEGLEILNHVLDKNICQVNKDFFQVSAFDLGGSDIDIVLSHSTIHCLTDARYGNQIPEETESQQRPYNVAKKIRELAGAKKLAVLFSAAISNQEILSRDFCSLDNQKLIHSFEREGFILKKAFYDKLCGGLNRNKPQIGERLTMELPLAHLHEHHYVVGSYYFEYDN